MIRTKALGYIVAGLIGYPLALALSPIFIALFGIAGMVRGACELFDFFTSHATNLPWRLRILATTIRHGKVFRRCWHEGCPNFTSFQWTCDSCLGGEEAE